MLPVPNSTSNLRRYQELMAKKFKESEGAYYTVIDDLTQKLGDIDLQGQAVPGFELYGFPFITDWEHGWISATSVHQRLMLMKPEEVAHKHLTRRLTSYMFQNDMAAEYIKGILPDIKTRICPIYKKYMEMLTEYFRKLSVEDAKQIPLTWLEVHHQKDGSLTTSLKDMPINQAVNHLDTYFLNEITKEGYWFGTNVIVIDEDFPTVHGDRTTHWLFAPTAYTHMLKTMYDVVNELDLETNGKYIHGLIKEYAV